MNKTPQPLVLERTVNAPTELVWKALTDIKTLQKWQPHFVTFKPEVGFETRFMLGADETKQYEHICEVTEVVEGKKLTYSWRYAGLPGDSYVTYELQPVGGKTKVVLTHRITEPFAADNPDFSSDNFTKGWTYMINNLKEFMENQQ